jgi:CopG antitoxin of type II toxin-antitoxin system
MPPKWAFAKQVNAASIGQTKGFAMSKIHSIPVRVPEDLRLKLEAEAKATDRPLSSLVRVLLQEAFSKRGDEQRSAA